MSKVITGRGKIEFSKVEALEINTQLDRFYDHLPSNINIAKSYA